MIAASGSKGSRRPIAAAVPGMNCAIPSAPAGERAKGLKFDSAYSCAASRCADTLQRCAARMISGAKRAGTKDWTARVARPSPPWAPKPTDELPGLRV